MRGRIWIFAAVVAAALALHLAMLSAKVAKIGEDNVRSHLALSTSALRAQLDLVDARLSPRLLSLVPELVEATRVPADPAEAGAKPDERALRAAAAALSPEPDLLAVVNKQGAIVSRRGRAAQTLDNAAQLPLAKAALEGSPPPSFAAFDGSLYRLAAARMPGNPAAAVVGTLVDDRFAAQLKSQIDADVTLMQGGKVLASSLPPGDARARLLRWAAAPSPGYGELHVLLPGIGDQLSGKLPRGALRLAVRGALMPLDSGVQVALTVPAGPYLGWLARYQAFYAAGFVLFVLFTIFLGVLARPPVPAPAPIALVASPDDTVGPVKRHPRLTPLLGTDVGEGRTAPPPSDDVPWSASQSGELPIPDAAPEYEPQPAPPAMESLDSDLPPGADPFTHPPEPQLVSAEEVGLVDAEPVKSPPPPPMEEAGRNGAADRGDFSFAGLLDDARRAPAHQEPVLAAAGDEAEPLEAQAEEAEAEEAAAVEAAPAEEPEPEAVPAVAEAAERPSDALAAEEQPAPFPGDEPTRIEPVSAALLDKLRERDEELSQQSRQTERAPQQQAAPEANGTLQDSSMPAASAEDPDEPHWRETYDKFRELKAQLGESADKITFEKFASKLRKNRADLVAKHNCRGVRFSVYEKDGRAAIKASAIR